MKPINEDNPPADWWYISIHSQGGRPAFTQNPEHAARDRWGARILAPGAVNQVWKAEHKRAKAKRDKLWEKVLDLMESEQELIDRLATENDDIVKNKQTRRAVIENRSKQEGFLLALAELELPEGRSQTEKQDLEWAKKRADQKYDQASS